MVASEPSKDELEDLWKSGVRLDWAWVDFAVFFDRYALQALRTHPANDANVLGLDHPRYKELTRGWLPKTWEMRKRKLSITTENERIHLLGEIYAGHLWAIGCRTRSDGFDELARVPREYFFVDEELIDGRRPAIHWAKGELTSGSITYFDIRVVRAVPGDARPRAATATKRVISDARRPASKRKTSPREQSRKNTAGRHNTSDQILAATERLWFATPGFQTLSIKRMVPEVRGELLGQDKRDAEVVGYRSSSMAKVVGRALSEIRKRNKTNKSNKS